MLIKSPLDLFLVNSIPMTTSYSSSPTASGHGPQLDVHHILHHGATSSERVPSASSNASSSDAMRAMREPVTRPEASSSTSRDSMSTRADSRAAQSYVRTLPRKTTG